MPRIQNKTWYKRLKELAKQNDIRVVETDSNKNLNMWGNFYRTSDDSKKVIIISEELDLLQKNYTLANLIGCYTLPLGAGIGATMMDEKPGEGFKAEIFVFGHETRVFKEAREIANYLLFRENPEQFDPDSLKGIEAFIAATQTKEAV